MEIFKYKILLILFLGTIPGVSFSQIPNSGFEYWTAGNPEGWYALNLFGFGIPITQVAPGHSGSWALKGEVITSTIGDTILPLLVSGQSGDGFSISEKHSALTGYYKFLSAGGDQFVINILMYNSNNYIGGAYLFITDATVNYTLFTMPINYLSSEIPDHCIIQMMIGNPTSFIHPGSYYLIDDLSLATDTDIQNQPGAMVPAEFELLQNYPNPFNPTTKIKFLNKKSGNVSLKIYDILGNEIANLVNDHLSAGTYEVTFDASQLASGTYLYRLQIESFVETKKMILLR